MAVFDTIKTLSIFFAPILIPRAISLFRSFRSSLARRPSPQPVPPLAARALNILFCSTALFLLLSLPLNGGSLYSNGRNASTDNIFKLTSSRFNTPTELLFNRLARLQPHQQLAQQDSILKSKFTSPTARGLYLRLGAEPLLSCPFCSLDKPTTYLLYYLPFNTLLPHLLHLLVIGLATSGTLVGSKTGQWRKKFLLGSLALLAIELSVLIYEASPSFSASSRGGAHSKQNNWTYIYNNYPGPPPSSHVRFSTLRPLVFTIFDAACAALIYMSSTNRLFYTPPTPAEQVDQLVSMTMSAVTSATAKLQAVSVMRNVLARDTELRNTYDAFYAAAGTEGSGDDEWVWQEEEVMKAVSKAINKSKAQGRGTTADGDRETADDGADMVQIGANINSYVDGITAGLELAKG